jgi:hypothetical protein
MGRQLVRAAGRRYRCSRSGRFQLADRTSRPAQNPAAVYARSDHGSNAGSPARGRGVGRPARFLESTGLNPDRCCRAACLRGRLARGPNCRLPVEFSIGRTPRGLACRPGCGPADPVAHRCARAGGQLHHGGWGALAFDICSNLGPRGAGPRLCSLLGGGDSEDRFGGAASFNIQAGKSAGFDPWLARSTPSRSQLKLPIHDPPLGKHGLEFAAIPKSYPAAAAFEPFSSATCF